jgi:hypothetical protein
VPASPIVVVISPPESPVELRRALLSACAQAVKTAGCVEPDTGPAGTSTPAEGVIVATVTWSGTEHVRLEVALRKANQTVEREIDFAARDAPEERWRTTGLVIGTLASVLARNEFPSAGELPEPPEAEPAPAPSATEPAPPEAPAEPPSNAKETLLRPPHAHRRSSERTVRAHVDLSALVAPALVGGPFRLGGALGGRLHVRAVPYEPAATVEYSETLSDFHGIRARFFDAFLGFAVTGALGGPFSIVARGDGFVRWLEAHVEPSGSLGPTEKSRVLGGARVGLDGVMRVADPFSLFVGAAGLFAAGATDVSTHNRNVGSVPALSYELRLGVSLAP